MVEEIQQRQVRTMIGMIAFICTGALLSLLFINVLNIAKPTSEQGQQPSIEMTVAEDQ